MITKEEKEQFEIELEDILKDDDVESKPTKERIIDLFEVFLKHRQGVVPHDTVVKL